MKAIVCTKYGSPEVLQLQEVVNPVPKEHELLIRVHAVSVTSADCRIRSFQCPPLFWIPMRLVLGITKPRKPILGVELSGVVESVGRNVTRYKQGDAVFAMTGLRFGGYAEYVCLREDAMVALKPASLTYEEAAAVAFGGTSALHFLRKARIRSGMHVLIYGASGSVGTSAVQLAKKHFGAEVTAVCSGANEELVRSLGADRVLDYTRESFTERDDRYDIVFDAVGKLSKAMGRAALKPNGVFVSVEGQGVAKELPEDMPFLRALVESGELRAVVDRRYPLEQAAEAHRYVSAGHKRGNVILTVK
ncbi:NAD(P)-dependent alcohol dehydrogenase [Paenibacillus koleovorans]|uniref:NAD(P)-dependent alcohol dehydrogenase n=1 Tax=Paenibacillus koleovorans TaxID=121608 RepID=UPI000FD8AE9D|nr:NAD(P)-dependent alcohol dehydrogenase [Paenibacillus koleovorans]